MKSSEILSKAADIIEQEIVDYKGNKALGGCYAIIMAAGYQGKDVIGFSQKSEIAYKYFEKQQPKRQEYGLHWWYPLGNEPRRIKALRDAAKDALENGD